MKKQYIVIGSGPAGVSAAHALLARDLFVTMLDVGIELDESRKKLLEQLQLQWNEKIYAPLKHQINAKNNIKLSYASDYPYREISDHIKIVTDQNTQCTPSFARGGLSNVWGAYVAPYDENDIQQWPIKLSELAPYYQKVTQILPINKNHQLSQQASTLLQNISQHKESLKSAGFSAHTAHLSVYFNGKKTNNGCFYCGNCQHGCPNSLIYSANDTLEELLKNPNFFYMKNTVVEKIEERDNKAIIFAYLLSSPKKIITYACERVFLAAGAIFSTKILLNSLGLFNYPVLLKQSQHFMLPCLMKKSTLRVENEKLHTLTQLVLRLTNKNIACHPIHLQIYTYMDHYTAQFRNVLKKLPFVRFFLKPVINRLLMIQGYFHSDDSLSCEVKLSDDAKTLFLRQTNNLINSRGKINALNRYLMKHHKKLGFLPIGLMKKSSKLLRSNHYGGSFPMCANERTLTKTDLHGRPFGMNNLHVIDATIFPTIPAQSITLTVMANAYRIATECPL